MAEDHDQDAMTLSVQLANQIINIANSRMEEGMPPHVIASGVRHAAANFSAFAHHRGGGTDDDLAPIVEAFLQMFEYYLQRHQPGQSGQGQQPAGGLGALIDQAKNEL